MLLLFSCSEGYTGPLCGVCQPGYELYISLLICSSQSIHYFLLKFSCLLILFPLILVVQLSRVGAVVHPLSRQRQCLLVARSLCGGRLGGSGRLLCGQTTRHNQVCERCQGVGLLFGMGFH